MYEGRQVLECSKLVKIGKNCVIDPSAVIHGPTTIGDNVTINAGAVIENCIIGNNVNVSQDVPVDAVGGGGWHLPAVPRRTVHDHDHGKQHDRAEYLPANVRDRTEHVHRRRLHIHRLQPDPRADPCRGWSMANLSYANRPVIGRLRGTQLPHWFGYDRLPGAHHRIGCCAGCARRNGA
ncbi:MAG: hypothetical protein MZV64_19660 [Ignavibacteriales bacterium]|nr:hypothetical protein [Ignavibacteriales bacterium]